MEKLKILITGSTGLIGTRITELLGDKHTFIPLLQSEIDITDKVSVDSRLSSVDFDLLLHLAAYTNVDGAENDKDLCRKINVDGTRNLFEACQEKKANMIHISTDFVFDGKPNDKVLSAECQVLSAQAEPANTLGTWDSGLGTHIPTFTESSTPNPISHYGLTKYEAEQVVKDNAMIVRLSYPYRKEFPDKRDFVRTVKFLLEQGKTLQMVTDSLITPTFIDDMIYGLDYLFAHYSTEIFHLVGADSMSPFDAGKMIAKAFGLNEGLIQPTTYVEYFKGKALRPQWARIVNTKGIPMLSFGEGFSELCNDL
jgi:dTDP-4-dehydrorhamnose reductase